MTESDEEDKLQYLKQDYFHPVTRPSWFGHPNLDDKSTGDDSNQFFMSEPSVSEADTSSEQMRLLSPIGSLSDGSVDQDCLPPAAPPPARLLNVNGPQSPGSISLSSLESAHLDRRIHIDTAPTTGVQTRNLPSSNQQTTSNTDGKTPDQYSSISASPVSEGGQQLLDVFLNDLRLQSQGQMQEQSSANISFGSPFQGPDNTLLTQHIIRSGNETPQHERMNSVDTAVVRNTSASSLSIPLLPNSTGTEPDDTIVMELSGSEDEFGSRGNNTISTNEDSSLTLDWEQQHSAEDETTEASKTKVGVDKTRRTKGKQLGAKIGHSRKRSGDAAAATLSTGSKEWKGMEQDNIPLPPTPGDDEEDDNHGQDNQQEIDQDVSPPNDDPLQIDVTVATRGNSAGDVAQFSNFALGIAEQDLTTSTSRRQSRRQRRDNRARKINDVDSESSSIASNTSPRGSFLNQSFPFTRETVKTTDSSVNYPAHYSSPKSERQQTIKTVPLHSRSATQVPNDYSRVYEQQQQHHASYSGSTTYQPAPWGQGWNSSNKTSAYPFSTRFSNNQEPFLTPHSGFGMPPFLGLNRSYETTPLSTDKQNMVQQDDSSHDFQSDSNSSDQEEYRNVRFTDPSVMDHNASPFANFGKAAEKVDRRRFLPQTSAVSNDDDKTYPTYVCPNCKTRQREFFDFHSAPAQFESPGGYIALYFGIYVIVALYIFGLQEGWGKLDCFYFAVITLTTAGLGDFVPTSNGAKVICSIFIYFGVACIGLLLGSYIAGMLDESSSRVAKQNRLKSCPNCARIQNIKDDAERRAKEYHRKAKVKATNDVHQASRFMSEGGAYQPDMKKIKREHNKKQQRISDLTQSERSEKVTSHHEMASPALREAKPFKSKPQKQSLSPSQPQKPPISPKDGTIYTKATGTSPTVIQSVSNSSISPVAQQQPFQQHLLGSPMTSQILGRQSHTRHASLDIGSAGAFSRSVRDGFQKQTRRFSVDVPTLPTTQEEPTGDVIYSLTPPPPKSQWNDNFANFDGNRKNKMRSAYSFEDYGDSNSDSDVSSSSSTSEDSEVSLERQYSGVKNAKYVFLTLREALLNSMVIIAFGCMGFYFIEGFSFVDSWYFTTVLLTTVGYGDIVPHTRGGKLFATVYILVAGTILLNNMSMISMIPLELRRRRTELAVLSQFGDSLDDAALRELATGPLIQRLNLSTNHPGGLDECTREMFSLAMLVRLGKVTEDDIKMTFAAFRKLDVHDDGVLNSKSIIAGMIQKRKADILTNSFLNLAAMDSRQQYPMTHQMSSSLWSRSSWGNGMWAPTQQQQLQQQQQPPNGTINEYSSLVAGQPTYGLHQTSPREMSTEAGSPRYI
jgi:hypothetical protein